MMKRRDEVMAKLMPHMKRPTNAQRRTATEESHLNVGNLLGMRGVLHLVLLT